MSTTISTLPGDTFAGLGCTFLGDGLRGFDIVDFNGLDPAVIFDEIPGEIRLDIPDPLDLFAPARPLLDRGAQVLGDIEGAIGQIAAVLPPELAGYTDEALKFLGEINGALGDVESTITEVLQEIPGAARAILGDSTYRVVEWMLHRSREGFTIGEAVQFAASELGL